MPRAVLRQPTSRCAVQYSRRPAGQGRAAGARPAAAGTCPQPAGAQGGARRSGCGWTVGVCMRGPPQACRRGQAASGEEGGAHGRETARAEARPTKPAPCGCVALLTLLARTCAEGGCAQGLRPSGPITPSPHSLPLPGPCQCPGPSLPPFLPRPTWASGSPLQAWASGRRPARP